jgi:hypothetical protein
VLGPGIVHHLQLKLNRSHDMREPVQLAADVIREAVTCERAECTPEEHVRFVEENLQIAAEQIRNPEIP